MYRGRKGRINNGEEDWANVKQKDKHFPCNKRTVDENGRLMSGRPRALLTEYSVFDCRNSGNNVSMSSQQNYPR